MKLRYIYIIVLCILTSGCNYLDIMPDERAKLEDSYNTPSKTEGFLYSCYTYMPMNRTSQDSQPYQSWYPTALLTGGPGRKLQGSDLRDEIYRYLRQR